MVVVFKLLAVLIIVYIIVSLFGYFIHKILHKKWTGPLYRSHDVHHNTLYPISDFESEKYRDAGKDDSFWPFAVASIPLILFPFILSFIGLISWTMAIIIIIEMLFIGWLNTYMHNVFHIKNHWLSRFFITKYLYNKYKNLHYIHHKYQTINYGIFAFHWDKLFKTFRGN